MTFSVSGGTVLLRSDSPRKEGGFSPEVSWEKVATKTQLGGGNSNIFYFHPYLGKIPILTNIFQMGWNHQLDNHDSALSAW